MSTENRSQTDEENDAIDSIALETLGSGISSENHASSRTTGDGRSYFMTEHGDGEPINEYCDNHRLDLSARLMLFKQVCEAVHLAHQHGIIHGDLKPSNILVTSDGMAELVSSSARTQSIARRMKILKREELTAFVHGEELVRTPDFASPEQVKGETVTTASDIYSLGVILYLLLTGRQPYCVESGDTSQALKAVCEQVPQKPSEIAVVPGCSPKRLKRLLAGDLDAIILLALRKEPERRYSSAERFADDVGRYLTGLPVCAHRGSTVGRAVRFLHRHTVAAILCGMFVLALILGFAGIITDLISARRQRDRARDSFNRARQAVNQIFARVSQGRIFNQPGMHPVRNALLKDTQQFYEDFLNHHGGDPTLPAELASATTHVAQILSVKGSTTEAIGQFQHAVAIWESLVSAQPANAAYREGLARTLNEQGMVIMQSKDRRAEALGIFQRARGLIEADVAERHSTETAHELSTILLNIVEMRREQGQEEEAIKCVEQSLAIESQQAIEDPNPLDSSIFMAKGHALLGQILMEKLEGSEPALAEFQQAVTLLEQVTRQHPELADQDLELAFSLGNLSYVQQKTGKLDSALSSAKKAVEILERLDRRYPNVLSHQESLVSSYMMISGAHRLRREPSEALAFAQKARILLEQLVGLHPENVNLRLDLADSQNRLGRLLKQTGEPVEALRSFQHAIDIYESMPELDRRNRYLLAGNVALSIPLIGVKNGSGDALNFLKLSKGDLLRRERYGNRALELLHQAAEGGFPDLETLQTDPDLDSIRDRPDFQSIIDEVAARTSEAK